MRKNIEQLRTLINHHIAAILLTGASVFYAGPIIAVTPAPSFNTSVVDRAMSLPLLKFGTTENYPYGSVAPGLHYLSLIAFLNPDAKSSNGSPVADRIVAHLDNVVIAGNEPELRGIQMGWHDHHLGAVIALAKYTPTVWSKLSSDTITRLDWIMRVGTYTGNIQHNAANSCNLDMQMKYGGNYAPNQRNPMVAWMTYAYIYFGGAQAVNAMLSSYDHASLITHLSDYGWSKLLETMNNPETVTLMSQGGDAIVSKCKINPDGVRKPFTFKGLTVTDSACPGYWAGDDVPYEPVELLRREEYEYNLAAKVIDQACKIDSKCGVAGHISEGNSSPHLGEIGMFLEYNLNGRSSPDYVAWGAKNALFHYMTIVATGYWETGNPKFDEITNRFATATEVWQYRVNGEKWYDTTRCDLGSGPDLFLGSDFALDLFNAMIKSGLQWSYAPVTNQNMNVPIPNPMIQIKVQ